MCLNALAGTKTQRQDVNIVGTRLSLPKAQTWRLDFVRTARQDAQAQGPARREPGQSCAEAEISLHPLLGRSFAVGCCRGSTRCRIGRLPPRRFAGLRASAERCIQVAAKLSTIGFKLYIVPLGTYAGFEDVIGDLPVILGWDGAAVLEFLRRSPASRR